MKTETILVGFIVAVVVTRLAQKKSLTDPKFILGVVGVSWGLAILNDIDSRIAARFALLIALSFLFVGNGGKEIFALLGAKK